jgi:hypothetical protein
MRWTMRIWVRQSSVQRAKHHCHTVRVKRVWAIFHCDGLEDNCKIAFFIYLSIALYLAPLSVTISACIIRPGRTRASSAQTRRAGGQDAHAGARRRQGRSSAVGGRGQ